MTTQFPHLAQSPPPLPAFRYSSLIRTPDHVPPPTFTLVPDLTKIIRRHLAVQMARKMRDTAERILVIAGPPGVGKTQGAVYGSLSFGWAVASISSSMLASEVEGGATAELNAMLAEFERFSAQHRLRIVVLFDDFDLSIAARDDKTGVSSNSNLLIERLQYLADNRHIYRNFDGSNLPFIVTLNDGTALRPSLLRDMRASWFTHDPDAATKSNIAYRILDPQTAAERTLVNKLIRKYANEPLSFWQALRMDLDAQRLDAVIATGVADPKTIDAALALRQPLDPALVEAAALTRSRPRRFNFLSRR